MVCGGAGCLVAGVAVGEPRDVHLSSVPAESWLALVYLVVFGSMVAYTAYVWLLHNARLSLVTTYAYVNPLVAVALGALFVNEPITVRTLVASLAIVVGVALIITRANTRREEAVESEMREPENVV